MKPTKVSTSPDNFASLRKDFPILTRKVNGKPLIYLDNAATTQKPEKVISAMTHYYTHYNANVHRGIHKLSEEATLAYESAHERVADFIHAQSMQEIIFTRNCSDSLNIAARLLEPMVEKNDEMVITQMEHHSNLVPWQELAKRKKAKLKFISINPQTGLLDESKLDSIVTEKTKIVSLPHASNVLGTIPNVEKITNLAHTHGAKVVLDMAQSVGHFPVNVKKLGVDLAAFSGHKMYGPTGIGVLYSKKELLESLHPVNFGGDMVRTVSFESATWNDLPWKFEPGTPNIAEGIGLAAAIEYLQSLGMENVWKHEHELTKYAYEQFQNLKDVQLFGPEPKDRVGVFAFSIKNAHPHDIASILDLDGIAVRAGNHCAMPLTQLLNVSSTARASLGIYNTQSEVDALIQCISKVQKVFG